jgi:cephalosporin-C deacetylase-like acetyl esterase
MGQTALTGVRLALLLLWVAPPARADGVGFDLAAARRTDDLAAEAHAAQSAPAGVRLYEVAFGSLAWDRQGTARPIRIHGYLAIPAGGAPARKPAVIWAHGLGAQADSSTACEIARKLDAVALALSAPGVGGSEGAGPTFDDPRPIFATVPEIRQSWLYGYAYAILRGLSFLESRPEVDRGAMVVSGASMGGLASFMVGGVDARVRGLLPVAATGALRGAVGQGSWLRRLVESAAGLRPEQRPAQAFFRAFDPLVYAPRVHGPVYLLIGAQDEFFPLPQAVATYRALPPGSRLSVVPDYDHEWYFGYGCRAECMPAGAGGTSCPGAPVCPASCPEGARPPYCGPQASYNRHDEFTARWALLLRALLAQVARPRRGFAPPPATPTIVRHGEAIEVVPAPGPQLRAVRLAVSDNHGYTYGQHVLTRGHDGRYWFRGPVAPGAIVFAEVEGQDGAVTTSVPTLDPRARITLRPYGPHP